jgi:hypothetical protein
MHRTKEHSRAFWVRIVAVAVSWIVVAAAPAATINNLYNTGVNNAGAALVGAGVPDPHYSIIAPSGFTAQTVDDTVFPFPPWFPNNATSRWIGPSSSGAGPSGPWHYRTTFTVPPVAILSTVSVTGDWATDDNGTDIRINGISTGQTSPNHIALTPFSINSGFQYGVNTLDFFLTNTFQFTSPTGLRVDHIAGSFQVFPEPGTFYLAAGAVLLSVTALGRSRSRAFIRLAQ